MATYTERKRNYSQSSIHEDMKQPIKWMELPIMKFNEIAVPHHISQLKQFKVNIQKSARAGDIHGVQKEQVNASKEVKQLRTLVREMDSLRTNVLDTDLPKFDKLINNSRQAALATLQDYKDMLTQLPSFYPEDRWRNNEIETEEQQVDQQVQASVEVSRLADEVRFEERRAIVFEELQREIEEVHELYEQLAHIVETQAEPVTRIETQVEKAHDEVIEGERFLSQAAKMKVPQYGLAGAIIGTCVAGPVGFVAGAKLGGLVAVTCSFLGYTGGQFLRSKHQSTIESAQQPVQVSSIDVCQKSQD